MWNNLFSEPLADTSNIWHWGHSKVGRNITMQRLKKILFQNKRDLENLRFRGREFRGLFWPGYVWAIFVGLVDNAYKGLTTLHTHLKSVLWFLGSYPLPPLSSILSEISKGVWLMFGCSPAGTSSGLYFLYFLVQWPPTYWFSHFPNLIFLSKFQIPFLLVNLPFSLPLWHYISFAIL